jgi:hypothetical protein
MNKLPSVIQKEIWEYVRGDKTYWKSQLEPVIDQLEAHIDTIQNQIVTTKDASTKRSALLLESIHDKDGKVPYTFTSTNKTCEEQANAVRIRKWRIQIGHKASHLSAIYFESGSDLGSMLSVILP